MTSVTCRTLSGSCREWNICAARTSVPKLSSTTDFRALPGLRQRDRLAPGGAEADPGTVLYADDDGVQFGVTGHDEFGRLGVEVAEDGGIGEAQLTLHGGRARVEGLGGSDPLDSLEQLRRLPTLQPDEFDGPQWPGEDLTDTLCCCRSEEYHGRKGRIAASSRSHSHSWRSR